MVWTELGDTNTCTRHKPCAYFYRYLRSGICQGTRSGGGVNTVHGKLHWQGVVRLIFALRVTGLLIIYNLCWQVVMMVLSLSFSYICIINCSIETTHLDRRLSQEKSQKWISCPILDSVTNPELLCVQCVSMIIIGNSSSNNNRKGYNHPLRYSRTKTK